MTWIRRGLLMIAAAAIMGGPDCATTGPSASELLSNRRLVARAASDLDCPKPLDITPLDEATRIVNGCGRRATYVEICDGPGDSVTRRCTWLLNGAIRAATP